MDDGFYWAQVSSEDITIIEIIFGEYYILGDTKPQKARRWKILGKAEFKLIEKHKRLVQRHKVLQKAYVKLGGGGEVDGKIIEALRCPNCKGTDVSATSERICKDCGNAFNVGEVV